MPSTWWRTGRKQPPARRGCSRRPSPPCPARQAAALRPRSHHRSCLRARAARRASPRRGCRQPRRWEHRCRAGPARAWRRCPPPRLPRQRGHQSRASAPRPCRCGRRRVQSAPPRPSRRGPPRPLGPRRIGWSTASPPPRPASPAGGRASAPGGRAARSGRPCPRLPARPGPRWGGGQPPARRCRSRPSGFWRRPPSGGCRRAGSC
mmetsp:Transcript_37778/g.106789  ORF Transcript_37778/g.106789 Transcript_37778/m.106789 type:complete len:206 (+) Transcript_37778:636-1253(+)